MGGCLVLNGDGTGGPPLAAFGVPKPVPAENQPKPDEHPGEDAPEDVPEETATEEEEASVDCGGALPYTAGLRTRLSADALGGEVANGGAVAEWPACTGAGAAEETENFRPVYSSTGGPGAIHASVDFDGVDDLLRIPGDEVVLANGMQIVAVLRLGSPDLGQTVFSKGGDWGDDLFYLEVDNWFGTLTLTFMEESGGQGFIWEPLVENQWDIVSVSHGADSQVMGYFRGAFAGGSMGHSYGDPAGADFSIGAFIDATGGTWSHAEIGLAEVIVYDGVLPTADREAVECHLAAKYGLPVVQACD